ncbi:hypothetical protein Tco_1374436, partial [Tanacetum coccineum]
RMGTPTQYLCDYWSGWVRLPRWVKSKVCDWYWKRKDVTQGDWVEMDVCITRSSTKELFTPFKEPEREFQSSRKHFKTLSLDESRSPDFDLFSNQEEYSEEEVAETMARPKIEDKDNFELKGQFL